MANRRFDNVQVLGRNQVKLAGSFAPNGSSAVSADSREGRGFTVARTSAGLFTITLADKYAVFVSGRVSLQLATAADQFVQLGTVDMSAKTVQIRVWDVSGAAVADVAADANNRIHFEFTLLTSSVAPRRG